MKNCPLCRSVVEDNSPDSLTVHEVTIDYRKATVTRANKIISLTPTEYKMLSVMMASAGQVLTRDYLCNKVWCKPFDALTNNVDVFVNYLRKKIDTGFSKCVIKTIRYHGYTFELHKKDIEFICGTRIITQEDLEKKSEVPVKKLIDKSDFDGTNLYDEATQALKVLNEFI